MASICSQGKRSDVIEFPLPMLTFCNKIPYRNSFKGFNSPAGGVPGYNASSAVTLAGMELDTDQDRRNDWFDIAEVLIVPVVVATARLAGEEEAREEM